MTIVYKLKKSDHKNEIFHRLTLRMEDSCESDSNPVSVQVNIYHDMNGIVLETIDGKATYFHNPEKGRIMGDYGIILEIIDFDENECSIIIIAK